MFSFIYKLFKLFTNYNKSHAQSSRIKTDLKTTELFKWLFTNYNKSHKFNTHERPHAQSSRIKLPSTLPVFLMTGAAKRTA